MPNEPTGCGAVDYLGVCEGDVAVYCSGAFDLVRLDCADYQMTCGYINAETGYYCTSTPSEPPAPTPPESAPEPGDEPCGDVDYFGRCEGDVVVWCDLGMLQRRDCLAADGMPCGYVSDDVGYYCGGEPLTVPETP